MNKCETSPVAKLPESLSSEIPLAADSPEAEPVAVAETTSSEPTSEGALVKLESEIAHRQNEATTIDTDIITTQQALNAEREKLGLPPRCQTLPSIVGHKNQLAGVYCENASHLSDESTSSATCATDSVLPASIG